MSDSHTRRWNIEPTEFGMRICRGDHDTSEPCEWEFLYWSDIYLRVRQENATLITELREMPEKWHKHAKWKYMVIDEAHQEIVKCADDLTALLDKQEVSDD